jgi:hypothetical protein
MQSVGNISTGLFNQLRNQSKESGDICLEMDESNETSDTALLLSTISGTTECKQVVEELPSFKS